MIQVLSLKAPPTSWTAQQVSLCLRMRREMLANPEAFRHPWTPPFNARDWNVVAWTTSAFAAQCLGQTDDPAPETQPGELP